MINQFNTRIQQKTDTLANWQNANPVLRNGEIAVVKSGDKLKRPVTIDIKIGDGSTPFNSLPYFTTSKNWVGFFTEEENVPLTLEQNTHLRCTLEYSFDSYNWYDWEYSSSSISSPSGIILLRGKKNSGIFFGHHSFVFTSNSQIHCVGDLEALLDYRTNFENELRVPELSYPSYPLRNQYETDVFSYLFAGNTKIAYADNLKLPNPAYYKFTGLFSNCPNLISPPRLNYTELSDNCYESMFENCSKLTKAPTLPAIKIPNYAYSKMFKGCTKLTEPPVLPATTVGEYGYSEMFKDCTSLKKSPVLPATALNRYSYNEMFMNCTALTNGPELPAENDYTGMYNSMFEGCTSLISVAQKGLKTSVRPSSYLFHNMFKGCSSLKIPPDFISIPDDYGYTGASAFESMYEGCTSLQILPRGINYISTSGQPSSLFKRMFYGCSFTFSTTPSINRYCYELPYCYNSTSADIYEEFSNNFVPSVSDNIREVWVSYRYTNSNKVCYPAPDTPRILSHKVKPEYFSDTSYWGLCKYGYDPKTTLIEISPYYTYDWRDAGALLSSDLSFAFTVEVPAALVDKTLAVRISK